MTDGDPGGRASDTEAALDALAGVIVEHPVRIVLVVLVLTAGFATGLSQVGMSSGTNRFLDSVPEHHTSERVEERFGPRFEPDDETTQVIVSGEDVLAKSALLRQLDLAAEIESRDDLRVRSVDGIASAVARVLDPTATTTAARHRAIERASPTAVRSAIRTAVERRPSLQRLLGEERNLAEPRASATMMLVSHDVPEGDESALEAVQERLRTTAERTDGDLRVYGSALQGAGFDRAISSSLSLVVPVVLAFILVVLTIAYRDPVDLVLALVSLVVAIIWTFGFMGAVGIPFNLMMISVPVLLLGVGVDFGIHAINRYREERIEGRDVTGSLRVGMRSLIVAFGVVAATNVIGFSANATSGLAPVREFGLVVAVGMVFTLVIFGAFLPALKLIVDRRRAGGALEVSVSPLGSADSRLGSVLRASAHLARDRPAVLLAVILVVLAGAAVSATDVESKFETDDFLPYAEHPPQIAVLPDAIAPPAFESSATANYIDDTFETTDSAQVTLYFEGPFRRDHALEALHRAGADPPETIVREDGHAVSESIIDVIDAYAADDEAFAALVDRSDLTDNGVPDRNLEAIYAELDRSPYRDRAREYLTADRDAARVVYQVEADASQRAVSADSKAVAADARFDATATGGPVVFRALTEALLESALNSFIVALALSAVVLTVVFWRLEGYRSLGVVTMVPVVAAVVVLVGAMPVLGIAFNALTATILAISIGLGIDYAVHVTHRFVEEFDAREDAHAALLVTLGGTGGSLTASVLTTAGSAFCLTLAVSPMLAQFGLITGVSTVLSYIAAITVLPVILRAWAALVS